MVCRILLGPWFVGPDSAAAALVVEEAAAEPKQTQLEDEIQAVPAAGVAVAEEHTCVVFGAPKAPHGSCNTSTVSQRSAGAAALG